MVGGIPVNLSQLDFNNHSSNVDSVRRANIALITLVGVFVTLRIFVRAYLVRKIFVDDGTEMWDNVDVWIH